MQLPAAPALHEWRGMTGTDRNARRYPRLRLQGSAQLNTPVRRVAGELRSLSLGGGFVAGLPPLDEGTEVRLYLLLPGQHMPVTASARVLYSLLPGHRRVAGTGFAFSRLEDEALCRLDSYIRRARETYVELLYHLADEHPDAEAIRTLCLSLGIPPFLHAHELYKRVEETLLELDGLRS